MFYQFSKKSINNNKTFQKTDWQNLEEILKEPAVITICENPDISSALLMAIGIILTERQLAYMRLHTYHCKKHPVRIDDWNGVYPAEEELCPLCNKQFVKDKTNFDIEIITKFPIKFVEQ